MKNTGIIGVGKYVPSKVLTNADLERMVDTSDEWITTRTGIKERHIADPSEATSDLALNAGRKALENAGITAADLDLIIVATATPDHQFPATACFVQAGLGAFNASCFDVSAACSGFIYALECASNSIRAGHCRYALVIGAECMSRVTDWTDRNTCVLFGDGAGAAVVSATDSRGILATHLGCDGTKTGLLNLPAGGSRQPASLQTVEAKLHYVQMQGNEVFKVAVTRLAEAALEALKKAGLVCSDVDWIIPHQANIRIINAMSKRLGFANAQVFLNIEKYGNMSAACVPIALCEAVESKGIKKGDTVLLVAFGAGLVWGASVMEW